jgi:hypothetical protein
VSSPQQELLPNAPEPGDSTCSRLRKPNSDAPSPKVALLARSGAYRGNYASSKYFYLHMCRIPSMVPIVIRLKWKQGTGNVQSTHSNTGIDIRTKIVICSLAVEHPVYWRCCSAMMGSWRGSGSAWEMIIRASVQEVPNKDRVVVRAANNLKFIKL